MSWTAFIPFNFLLTLSSTCGVRIIMKNCPVTKTAWEAKSQSFTCKSPLVYHCIQDEERNLMETCMEAYRVDPSREGGCPWASYYDTGDSILGAVFHSCTGTGCPKENDSDYWTNELYKYPICLNHYNEIKEVTESTSSPSLDSNINECDGDQTVIIAIVATLIIGGVISVVVIAVICCRRRRKSNGASSVGSNESTTTPLVRVKSKTAESESANGHTSECISSNGLLRENIV